MNSKDGHYEFRDWAEVYYYLRDRAGIDDFFLNVIDDPAKVLVAGAPLPGNVLDIWTRTRRGIVEIDGWLPYEDEIDEWAEAQASEAL